MSLSASNRSSLFASPRVLPQKQPCTWIEINYAAYEANVATIRSLLRPNVLLGAMTKGNAYGLGFNEYIAMSHTYVDVYYAIDVDEAVYIRKFESLHQLPPKRIIVHGFHDEAIELNLCIQHDFEFVVDCVDHHKIIQATPLSARLKVHIFMDSGLNREGFRLEAIPRAVQELKKYQEKIDIVGVMTHLRAGYNAASNKQQIDDFTIAYNQIQKELTPDKKLEKSIGNSSASLSFPDIEQDIARLGFALIHGLWPAVEAERDVKKMQLHPVLSWKCKTNKVRHYQAGVDLVTEPQAGFGVKLSKPTTVAIIPFGSVDGYLTAEPDIIVSKNPYVLIKGQRCKVLLIELDSIAIDVTNVAEPWENIIVTLIGQDEGEFLSVNEVATWMPQNLTGVYSFLTCIHQDIPRMIIDEKLADRNVTTSPRALTF